MKTTFAALALCLTAFCTRTVAQNSPSATARGCVVYQRPSQAMASMNEYQKVQNLGTNIAVTGLDGSLLTLFDRLGPIFIPYPSDSSATREKAMAQIERARKTYPAFAERFAAIEKAWAAAAAREKVAAPPSVAASPSPQKAKGLEIVTNSGTKYENVTIARVEPDGLSIMHDDGAAKVPFTDLGEELRAKYGYDQVKGAAYAAQVTHAQRELLQKREDDRRAKEMAVKNAAETKGMCIQVSQVVPGGILADVSIEDYTGGMPTGILTGKRIFVQGLAGSAEGHYLILKVYPDGTHTFNDTAGASRTIEKWVLVPGTVKKITPMPYGPP